MKSKLIPFEYNNIVDKKKSSSGHYKGRFIRTTIESGEAGSSSTLGPLLGQIQVNMVDFCESFDELSSEHYYEINDLGVRLHKTETSFYYFVKYPSCTFFIHQFCLEVDWDLDEFIFECYCIRASDIWFLITMFSSIFGLSDYKMAKIIFGYLYSSIVRIEVLETKKKKILFWVIYIYIIYIRV